MRRAVVAVMAMLPLALGAGVAQAHGPGWGSGDGPGWGPGGQGSRTQVVAVAGTVVSVDPTTLSFAANAYEPQGEGPGWGHHGFQGPGHFSKEFLRPSGPAPTTTPVTIRTGTATRFRVNGRRGTISSLATGDRFVALFTGTRGEALSSLVAAPALAVDAHTPPTPEQLYAFVGTVSSVNTTADTVTVSVTNSLPSGLVPAASNPATFTVSGQTLFLGGSAANGLFGGSLNDVGTGDVVAGGEIGAAGETLSQVESTPLQVLIDFPAAPGSSTTSSSDRTQARDRAMSQALALFGYKMSVRSHGKTRKHGRSHAKTHGRRK